MQHKNLWWFTLAVSGVLLGLPSACAAARTRATSSSATALRPPTSVVVPPAGRVYPVHTRIVSTTFWVGEIADPGVPDGSQVCSAYDSQWAYHWSGVNKGRVPLTASGCPGAITGGCDGVTRGTQCGTEARTAAKNYFPTSGFKPKQNPFYLDLPYDDQ